MLEEGQLNLPDKVNETKKRREKEVEKKKGPGRPRKSMAWGKVSGNKIT